MRLKFYLLFAFYTLLFLFYPGDSYYVNFFAYNRPLFVEKQKIEEKKINPVPYLKNPYYLPSLSAEGIYVVDLPSFTPILKRNEKRQFLPASTTKIITALVASELYKPEDVITIKNVKIVENGQSMGLVQGEKITFENLLYGILIHSGNDAAYAIADDYGYDKFITLMNQKAKNLNMTDSFFKNPAGLDEFGHFSTPFDLALAGRELLKHPYLSKIVFTKEITIADVDFKYFHKLTNVNRLIGEISGLGGLKSGFTEEAGENLISFFKKNGHQFIIVILKSQDRFLDTTNTTRWIEENIDYIIL